MVESKAFRSHLARAARITIRTGHESAFEVYRDLYSHQNTLSPVIEGQCDEVDDTPLEDWLDEHFPERFNGRPLYSLLSFHFHPEHEEGLAVSMNDIRAMDGPWKGVRPIVCVGTTDNRGNISILMTQRRFQGMIYDIKNELAQEMHDNCTHYDHLWSHDPVQYARRIELSGYTRTGLLKAGCNLSAPKATLINPRVVRRFAYSYYLVNRLYGLRVR